MNGNVFGSLRFGALVAGFGLLLSMAQFGFAQQRPKRPGEAAPAGAQAPANNAGAPAEEGQFDDQPPPALGVMIDDNGNAEDGVEVVDVHPGSPAGKAGIRNGDHIISVDGKKVASPHELIALIRQQKKVENKAKIGIRRGKEDSTLEVVIADAPQTTRGGPMDNRGWLGIIGQPQQPGAAPINGVLVAQVYPKGPAEKAGIKAGDIITGVGKQKIGSAQDLVNVVGHMQAQAPVDVVVTRNGQEVPVKVVLGGRDQFAELAAETPEPRQPQEEDIHHDLSLMERHNAEQHVRIEHMLQQLLSEIQSLRQEVAALKGKNAAAAAPANEKAATGVAKAQE